MTFQDTVTAAREVLQAYEVTEVPDTLVGSLDTMRNSTIDLRYYDGREVTTKLQIVVREVKDTNTYRVASLHVEEDAEAYLVEVTNSQEFREELLDIEGTVLQ